MREKDKSQERMREETVNIKMEVSKRGFLDQYID